MTDWSDGYVTETDYLSGYYPGMSPLSQSFALLYSGHDAPAASDELNYCDLGCGFGLTTSLLAAVNPQHRYWGIDFNPAHIAGAEQTKAAAGISNVTFLEESFAKLGRIDLPQFDYVALHGVWSWISASNRQQIADFLLARLKPGGVVYVSYNSLPGWASNMPLRQLLVQRLEGRNEIMPEDVEEGLAFAKKLRNSGAAYFRLNPHSSMRLDQLDKMPRNYLAHEFFNKDWQPFYHSEVAADLKAAKLTFATTVSVTDQIDRLSVGDEASRELLTGPIPAAVRETIKDFLLNRQFRADLYVRGARRLSAADRERRLLAWPLALAQAPPALPMKARFPAGEITLDVQPHGAVLAALAKGPTTFGRLLDLPEVDANAAFMATIILICSGLVIPAISLDGKDRKAGADRFNRAILAKTGSWSGSLASPVTGAGVGVSEIEARLLAEELGLEIHRAADWGLTEDGSLTASPDAASSGRVASARDAFRARKLPVFQKLGIV